MVNGIIHLAFLDFSVVRLSSLVGSPLTGDRDNVIGLRLSLALVKSVHIFESLWRVGLSSPRVASLASFGASCVGLGIVSSTVVLYVWDQLIRLRRLLHRDDLFGEKITLSFESSSFHGSWGVSLLVIYWTSIVWTSVLREKVILVRGGSYLLSARAWNLDGHILHILRQMLVVLRVDTSLWLFVS